MSESVICVKGTSQTMKTRIETMGESKVNSLEERRQNKAENVIVKVRRNSGASSLDIINDINRSLRKEPDEIIIHSGTNDITIYLSTQVRAAQPTGESVKFASIFLGKKTLTLGTQKNPMELMRESSKVNQQIYCKNIKIPD